MLKNENIELLERIYNNLINRNEITVDDMGDLLFFITECRKKKEMQNNKSKKFNKDNKLYHRYMNNYCNAKKNNNIKLMKKYKELLEELKKVGR